MVTVNQMSKTAQYAANRLCQPLHVTLQTQTEVDVATGGG